MPAMKPGAPPRRADPKSKFHSHRAEVEGEVEQSIESTDAAKSDGETSTDGEEGQGE